MQKISLSLYRSNIIRGLAILAVVLLHVLAYPHGIYNGDKQLLFISLDQLSRFCVPAFLIISGYGLATKYGNEKINYFEFIKKRIGKLFPLYLLWSFASILIVKSVPAWSFDNQPISLITQLLLGQADYQLYFLPVLFQLYFLFPLLWLFRKKPNLLMISALLLQIALYVFYAARADNSERFEYVISLSWIGYFVFGIYLKLQELPKILIKSALPLSFIAAISVIAFSLRQINSGIDPLFALKFTKLAVIPFGFLINLSLITMILPTRNFFTGLVSKILAWLGENSFLIFLSHTVGLRIIYAISMKQLDPGTLMGTILMWIITIYLSLKILNEKKTKAVIPQ